VANANWPWGNSGGASALSLVGDGFVNFQAGNLDQLMGGFVASSTPCLDWLCYPYSMGIKSSSVEIWESGIKKTTYYVTHAITDVYTVERSGTAIYYKKNGIALGTYSGTVASSTPLWFSAAIGTYTTGRSVTAGWVFPSSVAWGRTNGVTTSGNSVTSSYAGSPAWGNSAAVSSQSIKSNTNGYVEFQTSSLSSTIPDVVAGGFYPASLYPCNSYTCLLHGIVVKTQEVSIWEYGTQVYITYPVTSATDVYRVHRGGYTVSYYRNGVRLHVSSVTYSTDELYFNTAIYNNGEECKNVVIGYW